MPVHPIVGKLGVTILGESGASATHYWDSGSDMLPKKNMADDQTSKDSQEDTVDRSISVWRQMLSGWVFKFIVLPLISIAVSGVLLSRITDWWGGPKAYHVYVVGDFSGPDRQTPDEIWEGISKTFDGKASIDDIPVSLQRVDDKGSIENAKKLSEKLVERSDTLMVIGHMTSSKSLVALPAYFQAEPPIPVILPVETNPNVIPPIISENRQYYPVLRFSPTDREQARTAAQLAFEKRKDAKAFWIIDDATNFTYSRFLTREFIAALQEKKQVAVLLSSSMMLPSLDTLTKFNIDCIFFIGIWSNALVLLEQVNTLWAKSTPPMVILSDAVVEEAMLLKPIQTKLADVYVTHPLPANIYQKDGYVSQGRDIGAIINHLLADTDLYFAEEMQRQSWLSYWFKWLLKMHDVADARQVLRSVMENAAIWDDRHFDGELGEYVFNKDGLRENTRFHIWQLSVNESDENRNVFKEVKLRSAR